MLEAQRTRSEVRQQYFKTLFDYQASIIALELAVGREIQREEYQDKQSYCGASCSSCLSASWLSALYVWRKPDAAEDGAAPSAAASTGRVTFLMEQQWLIQIETGQGRGSHEGAADPVHRPHCSGSCQACRRRAARRRHRSERDDASHRATRSCRARCSQRFSRLRQLPKSAQIQAANTQIHIENTRVEAERRRLAQAEIEAAARLEEATHDLGRSQRLYEKKAYSAKALEADELDKTATAAQLEAIRAQLKALQAATPATSASDSELRCTRAHLRNDRSVSTSPAENRLRRAKPSSKSSRWIRSGSRRPSLKKISEGSQDMSAPFSRPRHFPDKRIPGPARGYRQSRG